MKYCPDCGRPLTARPTFEGKSRPSCEACGYIYFADPKLAVAVVIVEAGAVLLSRRAIDPGRGKWSLPGGFVDRGEVVEAAAMREIKEELSLDVSIDRLIGLYSEAGRPVVLAAYEATRLRGQTQLNDEVLEVGFFAPDQLPELAFEQNRQVISDWLALRGRPRASKSSLPD